MIELLKTGELELLTIRKGDTEWPVRALLKWIKRRTEKYELGLQKKKGTESYPKGENIFYKTMCVGVWRKHKNHYKRGKRVTKKKSTSCKKGTVRDATKGAAVSSCYK